MKRSAVPLFVALVVGVLLSASPAASTPGIVHRVTVGSPDSVLFPPGSDANFSLVAIERGDGTVTGQWQDTFSGRGVPAFPVHVEISCLVVEGNDAWVSGLITHPDSLAGLPAITQVRDNGTSANDPPDQVSFTFQALSVDECLDQPDLPLFDLNNGEVEVR
jgi:hypothetical protein